MSICTLAKTEIIYSKNVRAKVAIDFTYTGGLNVWVDRPFYLVKWPQEKWPCDFHDDATPLSFQLQVTEDFF